MKIYMKIYLIVDGFGNKASVVCEDGSSDVTIHGLQDSGENLVNFESEAWSIPLWCKTHGFECKVREVEMPFDVCWDNAEFIDLQNADRLNADRLNADRLRNVTRVNPEMFEHSSLTMDEIIKEQMMTIFKSMDVHRLTKYFEVFVFDPAKSLDENMEIYHNDTMTADDVRSRLALMKYMGMQIESTVITRATRV